MLHVVGLIAAMSFGSVFAQESGAGQWQSFGTGTDGVAVSANVDSIEQGAAGAQAMVRLRNTRPAAGRATVQSDVLYTFDCASHAATRRLYVEHFADGNISARSDEGEPMPAVQIADGTPIGRVRAMVCATAG